MNDSIKQFLAGKDGVYYNVPESLYHGLDRVSNSALSRLKRSPAHYRYSSFDGSTEARLFGRAFHSALLTPDVFKSEYATFEGDRRTTGGKKAYAELVKTHGENVIRKGDVETIVAMRQSILQNTSASLLLSAEGKTEVSVLWNCEGVPAKSRIDKHIPSEGILVDLKSTRSAHPDAFAKSVASYGYYRQAPFYMHAAASSGLSADRFIFIAVEKDPPYGVGVYELSYGAFMQGHAEIMDLIRTYKQCSDQDAWPSYGNDIMTLDLPRWAAYEVEEE